MLGEQSIGMGGGDRICRHIYKSQFIPSNDQMKKYTKELYFSTMIRQAMKC